jgi:hypothetical protein
VLTKDLTGVELTTPGCIGRYDQHGNPAPWPEDFTPGSTPATGAS